MLPWGLLVAGILLGWSAVTGRSPAAVATAILQGKPLPDKKPLTTVPPPTASPPVAGVGGGGGGGGSWLTSTGSAKAESVVNVAMGQLGVKYAWGKESPRDGFDCSGLTWYSYKNGAGVSLPRTAAEQAVFSHRTTAPKNGDLVFLGTPAYHVGIYSGGSFINAPHTGDVVRVSPIPHSAYFGTVL